MADRRSLEQALFDIEAEVRVLLLLTRAQPDEAGWGRYGIPPERGYDLMRISACDSLATYSAMLRLDGSVSRALDAFHSE